MLYFCCTLSGRTHLLGKLNQCHRLGILQAYFRDIEDKPEREFRLSYGTSLTDVRIPCICNRM